MTGRGASELAKIATHSHDVVSPAQTLVLFALVGRHGVAPQNDLGVPLDASDRDTLEKSGLVETIKGEHNTLWLGLTDAGWTWVEAHTTKALPPHFVVLHHMMCRLGEHLEREGGTLRALIGERPPAPIR